MFLVSPRPLAGISEAGLTLGVVLNLPLPSNSFEPASPPPIL